MPANYAFINQLGALAEADGLPPIAGRLFALLLLSPRPMSLDAIADALGVSKGSASTDARLLLQHGWLRRVAQPADRRDYYEMAPDFFAELVRYRLRHWQELEQVVASGGARPGRSAAVRERLGYLRRAQRHFTAGLRVLLDEWHQAEHRPRPSRRAARR
jgi:DNA-binding MarR family transcriptional regulator